MELTSLKEQSRFELRFLLSAAALPWLVPHVSVRCVSGHTERVCLKISKLNKSFVLNFQELSVPKKGSVRGKLLTVLVGQPRDCTQVAKSILGET